MKGAKKITNSEDAIDSRDVIDRITYLEDFEDAETFPPEDYAEEIAELNALRALQEEAEGYASDWRYGATLIRDSHFTEYAQQLAEDIGAIDRKVAWPLNRIDWEAAAEDLKVDYTEVDFDGVAYYVR